MQKSIILLLLVAGVLTACSKSKSSKTGDNSLTGHWKLKETLFDPGDGSGTWQPANEADPVTITFSSGNSFSSTNSNFFNGVNYDRYKILDSVQVKLIRSSDQRPLTFRYEFSNEQLILKPPCIEACGLRFERIPNID